VRIRTIESLQYWQADCNYVANWRILPLFDSVTQKPTANAKALKECLGEECLGDTAIQRMSRGHSVTVNVGELVERTDAATTSGYLVTVHGMG
jgi:hypothetical protein